MKLLFWSFGKSTSVSNGSQVISEFIMDHDSHNITYPTTTTTTTIAPLTLTLMLILIIVPFVILRQTLRFLEDVRFYDYVTDDKDFEEYYETHVRNSPLPYRKLVLNPRNKHLTIGFSVRRTLSKSNANFPVIEKIIDSIIFLWELLITMCTCCWRAKKCVRDEDDEVRNQIQNDQAAPGSDSKESNTLIKMKVDVRAKECQGRSTESGSLRHLEKVGPDMTEHTKTSSAPQTPNRSSGSLRGIKNRSNTGQFYFDSVDDENDVPLYGLMDDNGYIFQREIDDDSTPVLIFINTRSGPQQGNVLLSQLRQVVNPIQVHDMADGLPNQPLKSFLRRFGDKLRILVCGGDGTIAWVINALDAVKKELSNPVSPPIGILPLGTGNDLARILGWGSGWSGSSDSILEILCHIATAHKTSLDRWNLSVIKSKDKHSKSITFMNYVGVGVDAGAALQVHILRQNRPKLFGVSRILNQFFYAFLGSPEVFYNSYNLVNMIELYCDGKLVKIPEDCQGIIFLNIDSYAGGTPLWSRTLHPINVVSNELNNGSSVSTWPRLNGKSHSLRDRLGELNFHESCYNDGLIDICYVRGAFHLGQIKVGLSNPKLLAQAKSVRIHVKKPLPIQTDGEPQLLKEKCDLCIERCDQTSMLESSLRNSAHQLKTVFSSPALANQLNNSTAVTNGYSSGENGDEYIASLSTACRRGIISESAYDWILQDTKARYRLKRKQFDDMRRFSFT